MSVYEEHLEAVKTKARSAATSNLRPRVKARRSRERFLRKKGVGGPFDDLSPSDVEKLRKDGTFSELTDVEGFRQRVTELEAEKAGWLDEILAREDDAVIAAIEDLPADIAMARDHEKQRAAFLGSRGVVSPEDAPIFVKDEYRTLLRRQKNDIEELGAGER